MNKKNLNDFDYSQLDKLSDLEHKRVLSILHPQDQFIRLQTEQLMNQMGLGNRSENNPYEYNEFLTAAKHCCIRGNKSYNNSEPKMTIFTRAMMTSDFPALLVSVTNKLLSQGWTNATTTYQDWTGTATVKDFKTASLISMSSFSKLNKIREGEEITNGDLSSSSESFKLETFARMFSVSRRSYITDELEVIKGAPLLMGSAAKQTVEETVWTVLLSNPTLADGIALVNADHGNLIDGALNTANLDLARAALGKQTSNRNRPESASNSSNRSESTRRDRANHRQCPVSRRFSESSGFRSPRFSFLYRMVSCQQHPASRACRHTC